MMRYRAGTCSSLREQASAPCCINSFRGSQTKIYKSGKRFPVCIFSAIHERFSTVFCTGNAASKQCNPESSVSIAVFAPVAAAAAAAAAAGRLRTAIPVALLLLLLLPP
jgi:hypothetical protein